MGFTFDDLLNRAKTSKNTFMHTELPAIEMHYQRFAGRAKLNIDTLYAFPIYLRETTESEKVAIFTAMGFDVIRMESDMLPLHHFIKNTNNGPCIEDQFLANQRNVFVFTIETSEQTLSFLLEYPLNDDPLANHTVDREALRQKQKRAAAQLRKLFNRNR